MTDNAPTITLSTWGMGPDTCKVEVDRYTNGRLALALVYWDEEMEGWFPHCKLTTNLPDQHLNPGEFFVKDWSENGPVIEALLEAGWLRPTGREVVSGFIAPAVMTAEGPLKEFLDNLPE